VEAKEAKLPQLNLRLKLQFHRRLLNKKKGVK
jgi:hypothetical protein